MLAGEELVSDRTLSNRLRLEAQDVLAGSMVVLSRRFTTCGGCDCSNSNMKVHVCLMADASAAASGARNSPTRDATSASAADPGAGRPHERT